VTAQMVKFGNISILKLYLFAVEELSLY